MLPVTATGSTLSLSRTPTILLAKSGPGSNDLLIDVP